MLFVNPVAQSVYTFCKSNEWEMHTDNFIMILNQHNILPEEEPATDAYERRSYMGVVQDERAKAIKEFQEKGFTLIHIGNGMFRLDSYINGLTTRMEKNVLSSEKRYLDDVKKLTKELMDGEHVDADYLKQIEDNARQSFRANNATIRTSVMLYKMINKNQTKKIEGK